jgi:alcohol dehydrogenase (cytochrome c)
MKAIRYAAYFLTWGAMLLGGASRIFAQDVPYKRIVNADSEPQNWVTYSADYQSHRYSKLSQINRSNVATLKAAWIYQRSQLAGEFIEASPIVVDGIMYVVEPPSTVTALDARTGLKIWSWSPTLPPVVNFYGLHANNRGVAILDQTVYVGTIDAHLAALDAKTGALRWIVEVEKNSDNHAIAGAPLAIDGKIIIGTGGGDRSAKGFLDAYDAKTGKRLWRIWTAPQPGEPGAETWGGAPTGGGDAWGAGSYDPELNLLYWGTGNPGGNGDARPGDNLYSCSLIAVDPDTGKMKWYFQFTPHDTHDYDATQPPVLFDSIVGGKARKLVGMANRNGFYYLLDRATGEFISATPFVKQNWVKEFDAKGRPIRLPTPAPTPQGVLAYPSASGGTNWAAPSFDPTTKTLYVNAREMADRMVLRPANADGQPVQAPNPAAGALAGGAVSGDEAYGAIRALDAITGKMKWEYKLLTPAWVSTLATAGGVVFSGTDEGDFFALDSMTGKLLWEFTMSGSNPRDSCITYAIDGKQYVIATSVNFYVAFALP